MTKRGKKKNNFHLSNRLSYTLIAIFILVAIGFGVYALSPGVIPNPGHNISQMSVPSPCVAGQVLTYDGSNWVCSTPPSLTKNMTVPIYLIIPYCVGAGTLATSTICNSVAAGSCQYGSPPNYQTGTTYYDCSSTGAVRVLRGTNTPACYGSGVPICPNNFIGYLVN
jgi:hypothetical protein